MNFCSCSIFRAGFIVAECAEIVPQNLLLKFSKKSGLLIPLYLKVENLSTYRETPFLIFFQVKYAYRFGHSLRYLELDVFPFLLSKGIIREIGALCALCVVTFLFVYFPSFPRSKALPSMPVGIPNHEPNTPQNCRSYCRRCCS